MSLICGSPSGFLKVFLARVVGLRTEGVTTVSTIEPSEANALWDFGL